ncbi:hypothetical protein FGG08_004301 [Glutinoglossum americanum]|uniref:Pyrimidine 5-nucleotidase n=1 Tax=Glutinoglossum americanum TaxID=1670608 RepID=A0A9P8KX78_9PEZI|nr:hypothetical protein FGG08_004301 [Glutinoglossum americanum]
MPELESLPGPKSVFFFDIDNCLYSKSKQVHKLMQESIDRYFINRLSLSPDEAATLHKDYYTQYGLALEGLILHHKVDPLEYNALVDDSLPLEGVIHPDPRLRKLLQDFDRSKVRLWLFTNAYINHGKRVVKLLGVDDLFDGITHCDYGASPLVCKPHDAMYGKAQAEAGAASPSDCYFVDDSYLNCKRAQDLGWTSVHILEPEDTEPAVKACKYQIRNLEELRAIFPQFFKSGKVTAEGLGHINKP